MKITVANISNTISTDDLSTVVGAIELQVSKDFYPEWKVEASIANVHSISNGKVSVDGTHDAIIYVGDSSADPTLGVNGALGYHSSNHSNTPYGFVYLDICSQYGEKWTTTLSHEVLELLADPNATKTAPGPSPYGNGGMVNFDLEVCDPTQGDGYEINGVIVSNFVGKSYFGLKGGSGKTNFLGLELQPFGVRPKGYFQYEDNYGAHQIYGHLVTDSMKRAKQEMGMARRNQRRAHRDLTKKGGLGMTTENSTQTLRVVLATNDDLRRKVQRAAILAAFNVIKDAGINITPADIEESRGDLAALSLPIAVENSSQPIKQDAGDVAIGVLIGVATGF